jgi:hypothetical protein
MRPGVIISFVGHIGAVLMTFLVWETRSVLLPSSGSVVPVEIVAVAPESNVRALAEDVEEEGEAEADESVEGDPQSAPAPAPRQQQPRRDEGFNLDEAEASMRNTDTHEGRRRQEGDRAERNQRGSGLGTDEVVAVEDRARALIRAHMRRCWRSPIDLPDPDRLVVVVEFEINRNGTLNGQPRVTSPRAGSYTFDPAMRTAVDNAVRAVRTCDPYPLPDDPVVGEHYDIWRTQVYTFRPSTN